MQLHNFEVYFVWVGYEEFGRIGSKWFCKENLENLEQKYDFDYSYSLNFDVIGKEINLIKVAEKNNLYKTILTQADVLNINVSPAKGIHHKIAKSDYQSIYDFSRKFDKKIQISAFTSTKSFKFMHSSRDLPNKCSQETLENLIK